MKTLHKITAIVALILLSIFLYNCKPPSPGLGQLFQNPPEEAKPWVYWYWRKASVSKDAITYELEAMKEAGLGGAYLFTVQGADDPPLYEPVAEQLTPYWFELV